MDRRLARISSVFLALLLPTTMFGQAIGIMDCQGFTRAIKSVDSATTQNIEVQVADAAGNPAQGVDVTLTEAGQGNVYHSVAQNGVAVFSDVPAGIYTVQSPLTGVSFSGISIGTAAYSAAAATAAGAVTVTAGSAAAVAGAVAVSEATASSSSQESSTPTPRPTPSPTAEGTPEPTASATPTATPTPEDCNCNPDDIPPEISEDDFYKDAAKPPNALSPSR